MNLSFLVRHSIGLPLIGLGLILFFFGHHYLGEVCPLDHLYKTQVVDLATHLGLPKTITDKPSQGDF